MQRLLPLAVGLASCMTSCFVRGTRVSTPAGTRRIEELDVGDAVLSACPTTGRIRIGTVTAIHTATAERVLSIEAEGGIRVRGVTAEHPFLVGAAWVAAGDLTVRMELVQLIGGTDLRRAAITAITEHEGAEEVHDLTVDGDHTFIADGVLVHNKSELLEVYDSDQWAQAPTPMDVLWVIDDSCSMAEEQQQLADSVHAFAAPLEEADVHIGVVTGSLDYADPDRCTLLGDPQTLTRDDDIATALAERVQVGVLGSDEQRGLETATCALGPPLSTGQNAGFSRPELPLLAIVVSDGDDCSGGCSGERVPVSELLAGLRSTRPADVQVGAIAAVGSCPDTEPGTRYLHAAALTGGAVGDICAPDWSEVLGELGEQATGLRTRFKLSHAPRPDTLEVTVDGVEVPDDPDHGWTFDPETWFLTFHGDRVPQVGSSIRADYALLPGVPVPPAEAQGTP